MNAVVLPSRTANGRARAAALQAHHPVSAGVGTVDFHSRGRLLIIGAPAAALDCARALQPSLQCLLLCPPGSRAAAASWPPGLVWLEGRLLQLEGHLGRFRAGVECDGVSLDPAPLFGDDSDAIDLILDLADPPSLAHELPPLGYFAPRDAAARAQALEALRGLVGEFEKPRYFAYDPALCAHGRNGLPGCRRCLDACPTQAIHSLGETIEVDAYLCQGGGSCASACPSGAIRYDYPSLSTLLGAVREALARYRSAGGEDPQLLFFDSASGQDSLARLAGGLPEAVLPFQVEELGAVGMDTWLAALAYGARSVVLFTTQAIPRSVLREISLQLSYARAILGGMGYRGDCLQLVLHQGEAAALDAAFGHAGVLPAIAPAGFLPFDEKRTTLGLAIDHLYARAPSPRPLAELPDDAPFGAIEIDAERCTLCMACVASCPAQALYAGDERPALQFIEFNCVQCGLCHMACPEDAVSLRPRMDYDQARSRALRTLHEEPPFLCIRCGKPFATRSVVQRLTERLTQHWMFQDEAARQRICMCQDCKVLDVFEQGHDPNVYDKPAREQ